ncbi:RNA-directed DNA polymerase, eukaryota, reverse transcriptase zinc-binding domain protein [Tanacetum coccineum]
MHDPREPHFLALERILRYVRGTLDHGLQFIRLLLHLWLLTQMLYGPGLKINLLKSKLTGIGVSKEDIDSAASTVGCSMFSSPFHYLGVKVGTSMSRLKSWKEITAKVSSRLLKWKLKTLSIGGRLTLLKSVLTAIPIFHMSLFKVPTGILKELESIRMNFFNGTDKSERKMVWIGWDNILASKKNEGLDLSKLFMEPRCCSFGCQKLMNKGSSGNVLFHAFSTLNNKGVDLLYFMRRKLDCSMAEKMSHSSLYLSFRRLPRGGIESEHYRNLCDVVSDITLPQMHNRWSWTFNASGEFSMPTRANLSARGLEIPSILCPSCNEAVESSSHIFFSCSLSRQVMFKLKEVKTLYLKDPLEEMNGENRDSHNESKISIMKYSKRDKTHEECWTLKNLEYCMCLPFVSMYPSFASDKQVIIDITVTNKDDGFEAKFYVEMNGHVKEIIRGKNEPEND